jgi:LacI family transcriptional regulator
MIVRFTDDERGGGARALPCEEIGRQAAALLVERIASSHGERRTIRLDASLCLRDSCGPPR